MAALPERVSVLLERSLALLEDAVEVRGLPARFRSEAERLVGALQEDFGLHLNDSSSLVVARQDYSEEELLELEGMLSQLDDLIERTVSVISHRPVSIQSILDDGLGQFEVLFTVDQATGSCPFSACASHAYNVVELARVVGDWHTARADEVSDHELEGLGEGHTLLSVRIEEDFILFGRPADRSDRNALARALTLLAWRIRSLINRKYRGRQEPPIPGSVPPSGKSGAEDFAGLAAYPLKHPLKPN